MPDPDPFLGKAGIIIRQTDDDHILIMAKMKMLPETVAKLPRDIYSTGILLYGSLGIMVQGGWTGPKHWSGMTHGEVLCDRTQPQDLEPINTDFIHEISCLDILQFVSATDMLKSARGE